MALIEAAPGMLHGTPGPAVGELAEAWRLFDPQVIVGHPTYNNADTISRLLTDGIRAAPRNFPGQRVCFVVSDGSWTAGNPERATMEAALSGARQALDSLDPAAREHILVVVTPYDGYGGCSVPGKGSALKLIFEESAACGLSMLILLDGDLRNDMARWQGVFARVEQEHRQRHPGRPFFITARYARHFVDASLSRFIVGPLTTLMGQYVPGGISGDIALSAGALRHERGPGWTEARRKYGTDISTTFDNIADPRTVIYEVYLGAKLHDITDEAKLSVMPGEVIGAALERLIHWQTQGEVITHVLHGQADQASTPEMWGPEKTGILFVDPGRTNVFDVDAKIDTLLGGFDAFSADVESVQGPEALARLRERREVLESLRRAGEGPLQFLGVDRDAWVEMLHRAVGHALGRGVVGAAKRCLSYLYTAAFLEFVKEKLADMGLTQLSAIRAAQKDLGVPAEQAEAFYSARVDDQARDLALKFFEQRQRILGYMG